MGKNNAFINAMKQVKRESVNVTPAIYASIALALHEECGFGYERINRVFAKSQAIWENHSSDVVGMIQLCEEKTNIRLQGDK